MHFPWGGTSGRTASSLQLKERKATGLDCFRMLHVSKVQQSFSARLSAFAPCPMFSFRPFLFATSSDPLTIYFSACHTRLCSWACLATRTLPFFGHFACSWHPFTRLKMKKDVCLLFPQVYQRISNIPSSVGCAMQDANEVPSAALSICFLGGIIFDLSKIVLVVQGIFLPIKVHRCQCSFLLCSLVWAKCSVFQDSLCQIQFISTQYAHVLGAFSWRLLSLVF